MECTVNITPKRLFLGVSEGYLIAYKKILKILQENSNILILKIPIEKVKSKEEKEREELQIKNCLIFKKLEKFFLESRLPFEKQTKKSVSAINLIHFL